MSHLTSLQKHLATVHGAPLLHGLGVEAVGAVDENPEKHIVKMTWNTPTYIYIYISISWLFYINGVMILYYPISNYVYRYTVYQCISSHIYI